MFLAGSINLSLSQSEKYYICKTGENKRILLEDHYTRDNYSKDSTTYSETGYDDNVLLLTNALKANGLYSEDKSTYYLERKLNGFEKFTNINIGDYFYLSASDNTYYEKVKGFVIDFNDVTGGGNIFYVALDNEGIDILQEYSNYFIAVNNKHLEKLDTTGVMDKAVLDKFKNIISDLIPKSKRKNIYIESEPVIKVFKGDFVNDMRMQARKIDQYLVCYVYRTDFEKYTSAVFIYDEDGHKLQELSNLQVDNFYYSTVIGIIEDKTDYRYKILTESGYYEGSGLDLFEFNGTEFISIANGFSFGV
jgi:hypothetical protein